MNQYPRLMQTDGMTGAIGQWALVALSVLCSVDGLRYLGEGQPLDAQCQPGNRRYPYEKISDIIAIFDEQYLEHKQFCGTTYETSKLF
eukprot:3605538-Karenia_brevis.AAC.1